MSDWSSDVCSSYLPRGSYSVRVTGAEREIAAQFRREPGLEAIDVDRMGEKLVLRGSIPDQDTRQRATAIAKAYAGDGLTDLTSITGRQMVADRESVGWGKRVSGGVNFGGRRLIQQKKKRN